ncbi:MAG: mycofactocin biosynthesis glycosyltransferase MftF [Intrasporangium sp.]|uniref:mycofactocin biosynthesis glycosyltransferase MftF n=1 Tax=Intrasporangium sp. TaxID=1925024 RepID=UPI00264A1377|nr:mycofactocin biosynthesis glycosyltransferase MftF [Intrasporangium sp.]MDN5798302.1 mycofactocin biosynthesis glycosyltransferase MftF [Intrasporangium sp.]
MSSGAGPGRAALGPAAPGLPAGVPVVWDRRARLSRDASFVTGGSPWGLARLAPPARGFARRLSDAGSLGVIPVDAAELRTADRLVERGLAHPRPRARPARDVVVVVPARDRPASLEACLASLAGLQVLVVDDASSEAARVERVAADHGARLERHAVNRGPASARNTGVAVTDVGLVAFVDSDCRAQPGWLDALVAHFDDPRVAAVAPRVRPLATGDCVLGRYEQARSALDMGAEPQLVRPGARLGFVPSATLVVRRKALVDNGFDPSMRVGEDVDLVWRLVEAGWHVRYDPSVSVWHEMRARPRDWLATRFVYGTSAPALERRHPGRLAPARPSAWNLAALACLVAGHPVPGLLTATGAASALARRLHEAGVPPWLAPVIVGKGLLADAVAIGHALRREWWPLGWLALATASRSSLGRAGAAAMLAPVALEIVRTRPRVNPLGYAALRLVDDAAYGSGVITSAIRERRPAALLPRPRLPFAHARRDGSRERP